MGSGACVLSGLVASAASTPSATASSSTQPSTVPQMAVPGFFRWRVSGARMPTVAKKL